MVMIVANATVRHAATAIIYCAWSGVDSPDPDSNAESAAVTKGRRDIGRSIHGRIRIDYRMWIHGRVSVWSRIRVYFRWRVTIPVITDVVVVLRGRRFTCTEHCHGRSNKSHP